MSAAPSFRVPKFCRASRGHGVPCGARAEDFAVAVAGVGGTEDAPICTLHALAVIAGGRPVIDRDKETERDRMIGLGVAVGRRVRA